MIFGITDALARKMTFRALYRFEFCGLLDCPILVVAIDDMPIGQLVECIGEDISDSGETLDCVVFDRLRAG